MYLSSLPSDVVFHVLTLLDDLGQLYDAVRSCRALYQAFDERRSLILQQVFAVQVATQQHNIKFKWGDAKCVKSMMVAISLRKHVAETEDIIKKCGNTPVDALSLHLSAWDTYLSFQHPNWVFQSFGQKLVSRLADLNRHEEALSYGEDLMHRILSGEVSKAESLLSCMVATDFQKFVIRLSILYSEADRHEDALRVLDECYEDKWCESQPGLQSHEVFKVLSLIYRRSAQGQPQQDVLQFFEKRIAADRDKTVKEAFCYKYKPPPFTHRWTTCLIIFHCDFNRTAEAIDAFKEAIRFSARNGLDTMGLVGMSRRLIRLLKTVEPPQTLEALQVREQIYHAMSASVGSGATVSAYVAWAKEYCSDLFALGKRDEALNVEKEVWDRLVRRSRRLNDRALIYHCRNAAWSLSKAYREAGETGAATKIENEYKTMAAERDRSSTNWSEVITRENREVETATQEIEVCCRIIDTPIIA